MKKNLFLQRKQTHDFLIMAHRGFWGGNIIENTIEAVELAFRAGADIAEVDVCRTIDEKYYLFHDENEPKLLGVPTNFKKLSSAAIESGEVYNSIGSPSGYKINTLETFLEWLPKGRLVNLDRSWEYWEDPEFFRIIDDSGKKDQLVLKSPVEKKWLDLFAANGDGLLYIPIVKKQEEAEMVLSYSSIQTIGLELIVPDDRSDLADEAWRERMREKGLMTVVNAENLGKGFNLFQQLTDDTALFQEEKWAPFVAFGADIIQTDWPNFLYEYRQEEKKG